VHQPLTGNGTIVARVATVQYTQAWTKAGVMIRETLAPGSAHAFMLVTPGGTKGLAFQRRVTTGGLSTTTSGAAGTAPMWVKLERVGATIFAYRSGDGLVWTLVGQDTIAMGATVHAGLALSSHDNAAIATATFDNVSVTPAWSGQDVGAVAAAGTSSCEGTTCAVTGSGADIWGAADEFHYRYRVISGDFDVAARVTTVENVSQWTKAGLMIRGSGAADSAHASVVATPTTKKGVAFQRRTIDGALSTSTAGPVLAPPVWLKLSRHGDVITAAYRRTDLEAWTVFAEDTISLPEVVLVGMAVSSHVDGKLATATFEAVQITGK
jgi:regulation of enolase protein 1 (concanavalin A-like superfamily)